MPVKMPVSPFVFLWTSCRLISRAWEVAGRRYDDPKLAKKSASSLLSDGNCAGSLELWKCRTSGGDFPATYFYFNVMFCGII